MSYRQKIEKYIRKNKSMIAKLMGVSSKDVSTSDLRILANSLSYRAGESHFLKNGGVIDPRFIDDIRLKPRQLKGPKALIDAIAWYEKGVLAKGSIATAIRNENKFSPKIELHLQKRRKDNYRKAFTKMSESVNSLKNTVSELTKLFNDNRSLHDKDYVREIKKKMTQLRGDMARCDYHARAGICWAVKIGIPFDQAKSGIQRVYLRHIQEAKDFDPNKDINVKKSLSRPLCLSSSLELIDKTLNSQGIKSSISKHIQDKSNKWDADLLLAKYEIQSKNEPVKIDQRKLFDQSFVFN